MADLLSIVVPGYNEKRTVVAVIERLLTIDLPLAREILVVNDGSTDGTQEVLDGIPARPELRVIHAPKNGGKGSAIRIGFSQARGTIDRKSTRLNSSHLGISYAVFCLKKKK